MQEEASKRRNCSFQTSFQQGQILSFEINLWLKLSQITSMSSPTSRGTSSSTYHPLLNTTTSLRSSLSLLPSSSDAFASTDDWTNVLTSTAKGCRYCSVCQVSPVGWGMDGSLTHIPMCYYTMEFKRLNTSDS